MTKLRDHKINPVNDLVDASRLETAEDPPWARSLYMLSYPHPTGEMKMALCFQRGPIGENGLNGISHEALLAVVLDRLRGFQEGPYACRENAVAITKVEEALMWLHKRTLDRMRRGVEGKNEP